MLAASAVFGILYLWQA